MTRKKLAVKQPQALRYEELEPRLLFSADAVPGLDSETTDEQALVEDISKDAPVEDGQEAEIGVQAAVEAGWELVFVNENVADYQQLIADLQGSDPNRIIEVVSLADDANGIDQVTEELASRQDLAAVHFISHGSQGQINLGNSWLTSNTLQENSAAVATWGQALTDTGDILFYGCNIAGDDDGQALMDDIAQLTGADVAASDDTTGHNSLGGDWDLEATSGVVETSVVVSADAQTDWQGLLAETIYVSHESAPDTSEVLSGNDYGQTFTYDSGNGTYNVNQLSLLLNRDADTTLQNITVSLRTSWDGADLASSTISSSSLSTSQTWEAFDIGDVSLTDGATYYIRVSSDSMDGKIWLGCDSSGTYADGDKIDVNGLPLAGEDLAFRVAETTTAPSNGTAIWAENFSAIPETSDWDGTNFGAEGTTTNTEQYRIMQGAESPYRDEKIVVGVTTGNYSTGMMWDGSSWSMLSLGKLGEVSESYWWGADVAYESQSGDAVLVWNDNSQVAGEKLRFSVWDGSSWTAPASIGAYTGSEPQQLKLASNPNSDEMVLVVSDSNADDHVLVWDGSAWGNALMIDSSGSAENDQSGISVTYEAQSGHAMVVYGHDGDADLYYRTWDGSTWSTESSLAAPGGVSSQTNWTCLASDPTSDRIAVSVQTTGADVWLSVWDGSAWETAILAETNATGTVYPDSAVAFESQSGQALAVYGESGQSSVQYRTWTSGSGWSAEQTGPNVGSTPNSMTLDSDPKSDAIMLSVQDSGSDLNMVLWNGASWGSVTEHETSTGETKNQPFVFLWDQNSNRLPVITSDGGGDSAAINVAENTTAVTTVTATDPDVGDTLTYSISGGADAAKFNINGTTGELTFAAAPDFETPTDTDTNNVYEVTVQVDDGNGGTDTQAISVTVTDVSSNVVVTTTADVSDGDTTSTEALNASKGADGFISLSEAITAANNSAETVTISFNITDPLVGGAHTFTIGAGGLPAITDTVIIDGTTDPDYAGDPIIRIDGSSAGAAVNGLTFADGSDGSEVKGLMITGFSQHGIQVDAGADGITITNNWIGTTGTGSVGVGNTDTGINIQGANTVVGGTGANDGNVITNNGNEGINVTGVGATGTYIQGNIIGLDPDGASGSGNADVGIALMSGANNTTIGGATAAARNIISNNFEGIEINSNNNTVQGNYIGTDITGTLDRGNRSDDGIELQNGATGNLIGGTSAGEGNLISGNAQNGIFINNADNNTVRGNLIGTDVNGTLGLGNTGSGIRIESSTGNTIGGTGAGDRNVISGNGDSGIYDYASTGTTILGNYIGVDATGTAALGNTDHGVSLWSTSNAVVGGSGANDGNVIGGNSLHGILLYSGSGHTIQGNCIGTDTSGTINLGNTYNGILGSTTPMNTLIGGTDAGEGNTIAFNNANGISISTGSGHSILSNAIYSNAELGIDLVGGTEDGYGVTGNDTGPPADTDTGANDLQNYPVLTSVTTNGSDSATIAGTLQTTASTSFRIEFFASAAFDPSGFGEAERYLGYADVTTDITGAAVFSTPLSVSLAVGEYVTATATEIDDPGQVGVDDQLAYGSTSEFSAVVMAAAANNAPVITSNGGGATADINVAENNTAVTTVTATDADVGDTLTYSISGGADQALFDINASTGELTFTAAPDFETPTDADADNVYEVTVQVDDGNGGTDTQQINVQVTDAASLWMTTEEDVNSPSGANGLDSWTGGSVLSFDDPNLAYDPGGTDGTLSNVLNLDNFVQDGDSRLDAVHYVGTGMTVGSNAISLQAGDILLSSVYPETLINSDASTLSVTSRDVFIFRPDNVSDYSLGGTFINLIVGQDLGIEIEGITLVEQTTTVGTGAGSTTLNPGDFLFTDRDNDSTIYRLQPGVLGDGATNTGTISVLVDGADIGINQTIHGVELVESDVTVGDRTLTSGQLLISLYSDDTVSGTAVSRSDIFILNVTDTGTTTTATAEAFFTGGDIGFDTWQESPWAVSLVPAETNTAPVLAGANDLTTINEDDVTNTGTLVSDLISGQITDADSGAASGIAVIGVDDTNGTWQYTTDGGSNWYAFGAVDASAARLLAADANTSVRFVPDADWNGTVTNGITFHAWDQTSGTAGSTTDLTTTYTVRDEFTSAAFTNNDGTANWTGGWAEVDGSGSGASVGDIVISGGELSIRGIGNTITREVDLSNADSASLSFDFRTTSGVESADPDSIVLEISANGGTDWTTLETFDGFDGVNSGNRNYDIAAFLASNTQVRFRVDNGYGGPDEYFLVDNIQINYSVTDVTGGSTAFSTATASSSITVTAVDDDAPTQVNNTGSTVAEGGTDIINNLELRYDDSEQPASSVTYTVTGGLANGQLESTGDPGVAITSFTQAQIDAGEVVYVHDGSNTTSDSFNFSVDDGQGNTLAGQSFALTITAVDDDAPTQVNNTGSTVAEGGTDTITNLELRYDDSEQPASSVTYTVTGGLANGQLELTGNPGVAITSFTQAQIDAGEVVYVHDGSNTTSDSFNFSVDDGQGNTLAGQSFALTITAVDDDAPTQVNNTGSTVAEGGTDTITNTELRYDDSEQPASAVTYTVTGGLANGQLELTGNPGVAITSFTQAQIDAGEVVYVHDGSNTTSDSFNFSVDDGQGNTLAGQSFAITVTAVDDDAPAQVNNTGSTVAEGGTDTITNTELRYDDSEQPASSVIYTVTGGLANGQLELTGNPGVAITSFTQNQIDAGEVVYVHDGSNTTSDSFNFSVDDGQGNTLAGQSFALTITAVDDDAPTQVNNTGSTVAEGGTDTITNTELRYDDSEQPASSVTYTVTGGLANGQLELTGNPGVAITSFTQAQIDAGEVVYIHDGSNTTSDSFNFSVDDGQGNTLAGQSFAITVTAVDDDAPTQVNNTGSTVAEGGTDTLTNLELRYDDSEQPASSVTYTVTGGLANGQLELTGSPAVAITSFTQAQIDAGEVVYVHDGSNTTSDSFNFSVDDGQGNTLAGQSFALTITAVDDDAPTQVNNAGSTVAEGGTDTITNTELSYDDSEQPASSVTYTVTGGLANGQLELAGNPGVAITSFTQAQIDAGEVVYVHDGSNTTSDSFNFSVDDGQGNTLAGQSFALTITAVDDDAPTQVNNTGSTVAEGGTDTITNLELRYDDSEQPASAVTYTVTGGLANGQLESTGNPGVAITSFTQAQIDAGEVVYVHDGSNTTSDSFNFSVDDGQGNTLAGQSFALTVTAVDDDAPAQVNNTGSTVAEGGTDTITNTELRYDDSEQPASSVAYTVTGGLANGQLELTGNPGVAITSFTQAQIDAGEVIYVHDGSNTTSDSFNFSVDDGQGNTLAGQSFALSITAVDDDAPVQVNNTGSTVAEGGTDTITNVELRYDDSEQPASAVTYTVTGGLANGQLELTGNPGVAITSFTQAQIDAGEVVYVHDGSNTTSDSFNFSVDDGQGNTLAGQSFALTVTAVDDEAPTQVNNTGSTVAEGGTDTINNTELRYDDSEQPASSVTYTVTGGLANGQLELTGNPGVAITSFTQAQIDAGEVVYVHDGSNTTSDSFNFSVDDGQGNTLAGQSFALTVTAVDDDAPAQVNNTGSTVAEGGTDTITNTELRYDDSEQPASAVTYTVTGGLANGQLELTGNPGVAITSFTQAQIDAGEVVYVHDGSNTTSDSLNFSVDDGQGNTLAGQSFALSITAVDDDAPAQVNNTGSTVAEGGTDTITNVELRYDDSEQPASSVTYTVTGGLANGQLELTGNPGVAITSFTQAQIDAGEVVYVHDGSNTTSDSFNFSVDDGQGNTLAGQSFALTVTAVDDEAPTQVNNTGSTVAEGGTDTITNVELRYDDSEQPASAVTYTVTGGLANGQLELTGNPGVAITSFTQAQVDAGEVVYVHDGSNTSSDSFNFSVDDGQGNTLAGQSFALTVTAVDDDAPTQVNNTGSTVAEGGTDTITNTELRYDDSEQPASSVTYTVTGGLANGQLELTGNPGVAITSFTQAQIDAGEVVYVHDGSNTTSDSFNFSVDDGQGNTLAGQSFALTVTAVDDDAPTQVNNTGSTVVEGGTDTITNTELRYDDSEQPAISVTYTVTGGLANGQLELTGNPGVAITSFTQAQIDAGEVVYVHDGSNTTSDSFNFSVDDGQGNTLAGQSFALTVTAVDDDAPAQVNNTGSTVAEGGTDTITNTELRYDDSEQPASAVTYTVTGGLANGQLELAGNPGVAITSFTQAQIDASEVVYVHDGSNTTSDSFNFSVDDGQGNTLAGQSFALTITAVDDDAPAQVDNTGSTVAEGGTDTITNTELRYDDSEQPASSVTYTVTGGLANGQLELTGNPGVAITSFTQAQIDAGEVVYVHDGSNTTSDSFNFIVDDGQGNTLAGQSFALTVTAVDDDAPTQVNNTGSTVAEGGTDTITNTELRYDDSEQPASSVTYTVTGGLANGQLELTGNPGVAITSFTQAQIDAGEVVYVHDGSNTTSDSFNFSVDDGQGNTLAGQSFAITVTAVDDDAPTQVNNTGSTVAEGGTDTITNTELRYDDSEQPASSVTYTVTGGLANGQLELTGNPGVAITSFTQVQIDAGEVVYVHDGSNTTSDSFNFSVDDGQGNTLAGQSFAITVTAVDDDAPAQVNNTGSTVAEGGTDTITNTELRYDDSEQPASSVTYTVTGGLGNGQLEITGNPGVAITSFTQAQIDAGEVVYVHDGSNTTSDSFNFSVDDGQGNTLVGQSFALTITAVDDDAPAQVNNTGSTVAEGGTDAITNTELRYDDSEQAASSVTYTVTGGLANGQLELTGNRGVAITSFTQAQIDAGEVVYVHDGSNTTSDSFNFNVDDGQGNTLAGQSFALTITAVDDDAPTQVNNTGSTVAEGGTDTITNTELRYDDSEQSASSVTYTVTGGLANGQLELTGNPGVAITSFTQAQIDAGEVVYVHDGSNTTSDSFNFSVDDGQGNTLAGQSFALTITAVDDDAPAQVNNTGSTVAEGGTDTITNTELRYDDSEQPASSVTYTVTGGLANGQLELTGNPGVAIISFTQAQIDAGEVVYVHDGSNTTSDSFNFIVDDGQGNTLAGQGFAITITPGDTGSGDDSDSGDGGTDSGVVPDIPEDEEDKDAEDGDSVIDVLPDLPGEELIPEDPIDMTDPIDVVEESEADDGGIIYLPDEDFMDTGIRERSNALNYEIIPSKYVFFDNNAIEGELAEYSAENFDLPELESADTSELRLNSEYDLMRQQMDESFNSELKSQARFTRIAAAITTTFSVGVVSYLLRAGSLLASLMSNIPLWRGYDPIAIFSGKRKKKEKHSETAQPEDLKSETLFDGDEK